MTNQSLAFFMGLFGSLHCVAMCGPLVMAFPQGNHQLGLALVQKAIYQLGRITTYAVLGLLAGLVGQGFNVLGLQQALGIVSGLVLVSIAILHFSKKTDSFNHFQIRVISPMVSILCKLLAKPYSGFFAGLIHGLLPCGMVYMALAAALNSGTSFVGGRFMFFFGMGTTPLLLLTAAAPLVIRKFKLPVFIIPYLFLSAGLILIGRGLNMDIPYLTSPVQVRSLSADCE